MSRTKRSYPKHKGYIWFREVRSKNIQTAEHYAALEIEEAGFKTANRQAARANPASGKIADAWDDLTLSAVRELDYKFGQYLP
jgi:hypothetical protein